MSHSAFYQRAIHLTFQPHPDYEDDLHYVSYQNTNPMWLYVNLDYDGNGRICCGDKNTW